MEESKLKSTSARDIAIDKQLSQLFKVKNGILNVLDAHRSRVQFDYHGVSSNIYFPESYPNESYSISSTADISKLLRLPEDRSELEKLCPFEDSFYLLRYQQAHRR